MSQPGSRNNRVRAISIRPISPPPAVAPLAADAVSANLLVPDAPASISQQRFGVEPGTSGDGAFVPGVQTGSAIRRSRNRRTFIVVPEGAAGGRTPTPPPEAERSLPPSANRRIPTTSSTPEPINAQFGPGVGSATALPSVPSNLDTMITQIEFDEIDETTGRNITVEVALPKENVSELAEVAETHGLMPVALTEEDVAEKGVEGVDEVTLHQSFAQLGRGKEAIIQGLAPLIDGEVPNYDMIARNRTWRQWFGFMRPAFTVVGFVFLNNFAKVMLSPLIPFVLTDYFGSQKEAAMVQTIFDGVRAFIAMLIVPIYGNMLDTLGRHPFFILSAILWTLPAAFFMAIPSNPIFYLFFQELASLFSTTYYLSYIADHYPDARDRAKAFAVIEGVSALANLLAFVGALVSKEVAGWITLALVMIRVPYACFLFTESLDRLQRKKMSCALFKTNPIAAVRVITQNKVLKAVTFIVVGLLITAIGNGEISSYFLQQRVGWAQADAYFGVIEAGVVTPFLLLILYPLLAKCIRPTRIASLTFLSLMLGTTALILLFEKWQVYAFVIPFSCATNLGVPALLGIFSNAGEGTDQGRRLAGVTAVMDFTSAIVPLAIGQLFHALPTELNWVPFVICVGASLPGFIVCLCCLPSWIAADRKDTLGKSFAVASGVPLH